MPQRERNPHADPAAPWRVRSWWPPTWPPAASTWPASASVSTSTCRACRRLRGIGRTGRAGATGTAIALVGCVTTRCRCAASSGLPATRFACMKWKAWCRFRPVRPQAKCRRWWSSAWRQAPEWRRRLAQEVVGDRDHQPREHRGDRRSMTGGDRQFHDRGGMGANARSEGQAKSASTSPTRPLWRPPAASRRPRQPRRPSVRSSATASRVCRPSGSGAASARRRPASPRAARPVRRTTSVSRPTTSNYKFVPERRLS